MNINSNLVGTSTYSYGTIGHTSKKNADRKNFSDFPKIADSEHAGMDVRTAKIWETPMCGKDPERLICYTKASITRNDSRNPLDRVYYTNYSLEGIRCVKEGDRDPDNPP